MTIIINFILKLKLSCGLLGLGFYCLLATVFVHQIIDWIYIKGKVTIRVNTKYHILLNADFFFFFPPGEPLALVRGILTQPTLTLKFCAAELMFGLEEPRLRGGGA